MASRPGVVPTTKHACGARDSKGRPCQGVPNVPCPRCLLVAYCGSACRERHWETKHKHACLASMAPKTRMMDPQGNDEATVYFTSQWSKAAATDVLNLEKNEGRYFDDYLQLLFTGDFGLRHFIYSVDKMPETASPMLSVNLNETDWFNLARTFFALHLLQSRDHDPVLNAEAVIHLWYSARMPKALLDHVNSVARKHIIYALDDLSCYYGTEKPDESQPCRSHTSQVNLSMDVELTRADWISLVRRLQVPTVGLTASVLIRQLDTLKNTESPERILARMTRSRASGLRKWHEDGLLLPFGHPRDGFDTLNPLFFASKDEFPVGATAEPLCEWPMEVLDYQGCAAPNDVYGKMFWYLRDLLVRFQGRISKTQLKVSLTCEAGETLPNWLPTLKIGSEFDRIEVGALWDQHPFLTLTLFSKLLRHEDENPYATLLTLTRDSVTHCMCCVHGDLQAEQLDMSRPTNTILDEYAPPVARDDCEKDPMKREVLRRKIGLLMWRNWDKFANRYLNAPSLFAFASLLHPEDVDEHRSVILAGFLGLSVRQKHIITRRWPNRLVHSRKDKPGLREFNRWLSWPDTEPQRWLEWKRSKELAEVEWIRWLGFAASRTRLDFDLMLEDIVLPGSSESVTVDGVEKASDGVPAETTKDGPQSIGDVPVETRKDGLEKAIDDATPKTTKDVPQKATDNGPLETTKDVLQKAADNVPLVTHKDGLERSIDGATLKTTKDALQKTADDVPLETPTDVLKTTNGVPLETMTNGQEGAVGDIPLESTKHELQRAAGDVPLQSIKDGLEPATGGAPRDTATNGLDKSASDMPLKNRGTPDFDSDTTINACDWTVKVEDWAEEVNEWVAKQERKVERDARRKMKAEEAHREMRAEEARKKMRAEDARMQIEADEAEQKRAEPEGSEMVPSMKAKKKKAKKAKKSKK